MFAIRPSSGWTIYSTNQMFWIYERLTSLATVLSVFGSLTRFDLWLNYTTTATLCASKFCDIVGVYLIYMNQSFLFVAQLWRRRRLRRLTGIGRRTRLFHQIETVVRSKFQILPKSHHSANLACLGGVQCERKFGISNTRIINEPQYLSRAASPKSV